MHNELMGMPHGRPVCNELHGQSYEMFAEWFRPNESATASHTNLPTTSAGV